MLFKDFKQRILAITLVFALILGTLFINSQPSIPSNIQSLDLKLTKNAFYIDEEDYAQTMQTEVEPYINTFKTTDYLTTSDHASLYYEHYLLENPLAHVVIAHGFTESSQKYKEVIYYFLKSGYSVSILDHRGHGYSDRMILDEDSSKVYIDTFDTYLNDLKSFMDQAVLPLSPDVPHFLYAHSMGGGMGALFIERYPEYFDAAVLSSPMMEIDTGSYPKPIATLITKLMVLLGQGKNYVFGHGPYENELNFEESPATSQPRYIYFAEKKQNDSALQLGGSTFSWLNASLNATKQLTKNAHLASIPILVFQSEKDDLVKPGGQYTFVQGAPNATLIYVPNAKHELYLTDNAILIPYFNTVLNFFESHIL